VVIPATRPAPGLTADERAEVKQVARLLLDRLEQLLVLNWRQKSGARAQLKLAIQAPSTLACRVPPPASAPRSAPPFASTFTRLIPNAMQAPTQTRPEACPILFSLASVEQGDVLAGFYGETIFRNARLPAGGVYCRVETVRVPPPGLGIFAAGCCAS